MKLGAISISASSTKLIFVYKKRNPASATGDYFDNTSITAANIVVINTETGATILASTAMTYVAALRGYRYVWTFGGGLSGVLAITVEVTPTRAGGVSAVLTPIDSEEFEIDDGPDNAAVSAIPDSLLDLEEVEIGLTVRQALRVIAAAMGGRVSGASSGIETFRAAGVPDTTRIVSTVDSLGNRTNVVLTP